MFLIDEHFGLSEVPTLKESIRLRISKKTFINMFFTISESGEWCNEKVIFSSAGARIVG